MSEYEELKKGFDDFGISMKKDKILENYMKLEDNVNLPIALVEKLITTDYETSDKNINLLREAIKNYKPATAKVNVSKEEFGKMGYMEKLKLHNENNDLYEKLCE